MNKERLEQLAFETAKKADEQGFDVNKEEISEASSLGEAYYMGRYEQILSLIEEEDADGGGAMFERVTGFPADTLFTSDEKEH